MLDESVICPTLYPITTFAKMGAGPLNRIILTTALLTLLSTPIMAQELGDGSYFCEGGLTTGIKAVNRQWTPIGQDTKNYTVSLKDNLTTATIDGMTYECQTKFFEILGCTTGYYHFSLNLTSGRFTFDQSYGFIRGETPGGDAEIITTTLGFCTPDLQG